MLLTNLYRIIKFAKDFILHLLWKKLNIQPDGVKSLDHIDHINHKFA